MIVPQAKMPDRGGFSFANSLPQVGPVSDQHLFAIPTNLAERLSGLGGWIVGLEWLLARGFAVNCRTIWIGVGHRDAVACAYRLHRG
jgi:hypothetical protein